MIGALRNFGLTRATTGGIVGGVLAGARPELRRTRPDAADRLRDLDDPARAPGAGLPGALGAHAARDRL